MPSDDRDLNELFRRDLSRIELPPSAVWLPGTRPLAPSRWRSLLAVPAAAAVIALALAVGFAIQVMRGEVAAPVTSPSPSATVAPSASASAVPSAASPSPAASPSAASLPASSAVKISGRLPSQGQWALIVRRGWDQSPTEPGHASGPPRLPATDSIMAVPLTARATTQRDTVHLLSFTSQVGWPVPCCDNLIREQISPDGRRLVLSVVATVGDTTRATLVVVDLVAGTVGTLVSDAAYHDTQPAWSPNGEEIAFARRTVAPSSEAGLWIVRADGTGLRRVVPGSGQDHGRSVFSWNGDGTAVGTAAGLDSLQYLLADARTGATTRLGDKFVGPRHTTDWRAGSPAFVGAFAGSGIDPRQPWSLVTADQRGGSARTILTDTLGGDTAFYRQPRWRPGADDILYVRVVIEGAQQSPPLRSTLFVTDANGRTPRAITQPTTLALLAAWTPDGRDIVVVRGQGSGGTVHLIAPDGSNERIVQGFGGIPEVIIDWIDLAVLGF